MFYSVDYKRIDELSVTLFTPGKSYIIKPSVCSEGGHGIKVWNYSQGLNQLDNLLKEYNDIVVQEILEQHREMAALHEGSLNTVRLVTLIYKNEVRLLSTIVRMGVDGSFVDNASSGGIFCGVMPDGHLKKVAYNTKGKEFKKHPQGAIFDEHYIPNFHQCVDMVKMLAPRISGISKMVSWDVAIAPNGNPVLIEANLCYGELDFHQIANGPLLGNLTSEVLQEVFSNKIYYYIVKLFKL